MPKKPNIFGEHEEDVVSNQERENVRTFVKPNCRRPRKLAAQGRYLVLPEDSINCIAEQVLDNDIELGPDVLQRLSEDATYRLYELIGNIKTAVIHSTGVVTSTIVNEVLATSNVPPILGKVAAKYRDLGDGEHLVETDPRIDIMRLILNDVKLKQPGSFAMRVIPHVLPKDVDTLRAFYTKWSRAILCGTRNQFQYSVFTLKTFIKYDPVVSNFLTLAVLILNLCNNSGCHEKPFSNVQQEHNHWLLRRVLLLVEAIASNIEFAELSNLRVQLTHLVHELLRILLLKIRFVKIIKKPKGKLMNNTDIKTIKKPIRKPNNKTSRITKKMTNNKAKKVIKKKLVKIVKKSGISEIATKPNNVEESHKKNNVGRVPQTNVQNTKRVFDANCHQEITSKENLICKVLGAITRRWPYARFLVLNLVEKTLFNENTSKKLYDQGFIIALKIFTYTGIIGNVRFWSVILPKTFKSMSQDTLALIIKAALKFYMYFPIFQDVHDIDRWLYEVLGDAVLPLRTSQLEYQMQPERSIFKPKIESIRRHCRFKKLSKKEDKNSLNVHFGSNNKIITDNRIKQIKFNIPECKQLEIKAKKTFQFKPLYYDRPPNKPKTHNYVLIGKIIWIYIDRRNTYKYDLHAFHL